MAVRSGAGKGWWTVLVCLGLGLVALFSLAACTATLAIPNFTIAAYQGAEELGGEQVTVQGLLDQGKPVVLNFWAGACPPCRAEMPDFQKVYNRRHQEVTIVGVDVGPYLYLGTREEGKALLKELGLTYPAGITYDEQAVRSLEIFGMPTTIFLRANGKVHRKWTGFLTEEKLDQIIGELLGRS